MKRFLKRFIAPLILCAVGFLLAYGAKYLPSEPALLGQIVGAVFFLLVVPLFTFFLIWAIWAGLRDIWITRVRGEARPTAEEVRMKRVLSGAPGQMRKLSGGARFGNFLLRLLSWILLFGGAFLNWVGTGDAVLTLPLPADGKVFLGAACSQSPLDMKKTESGYRIALPETCDPIDTVIRLTAGLPE